MLILDNAIPFHRMHDIHLFVINSLFEIGWKDTTKLDNNFSYVHSKYSIDDINRSGILNDLSKTSLWNSLKGLNISSAVVNMSKPVDVHYAHTHSGSLVLLYYANLEWKPEWAGETLFYKNDLSDIEKAVMYKPGRLVLFDGEIPHTIRPQSMVGPSYRFTMSIFFKKVLT